MSAWQPVTQPRVGNIVYYYPKSIPAYQVRRLVRRIGGTDESEVVDTFETASKADTFYKNCVKNETLFPEDSAWQVVQVQRMTVVTRGMRSKRFIWTS